MSKNNSDTEVINRIIHLMQADDSTDAPPDAVKWSKNIFRNRVTAPKKSLLQRVSAVLQMDLSPNKAAFGERSASASQVRQMLFQAGETSIDLRIKQQENVFSVHGQILGEDFANAAIKLGDFETTANEVSEFKLANIPNGTYNFSVQGSEKEIVFPGLEL